MSNSITNIGGFQNLVNPSGSTVPLNDSVISTNLGWSSSKIETRVESLISDSTTATTTTWSSDKINSSISSVTLDPFTSNIIPDTDLTYILGDTGYRMSEVYSQNVSLDNLVDASDIVMLDTITNAGKLTSHTDILVDTNNVYNLGEVTNRFNDAYIDKVYANTRVETDALRRTADVADTIVLEASEIQVSKHITPTSDNTLDIGSGALSRYFRDAYLHNVLTDQIQDISGNTNLTTGATDLTLNASSLLPAVNNTQFLGGTSNQFNNIYVRAITYNFGDKMRFDTGGVGCIGNTFPDSHNTYDLGTLSSNEWKDGFFAGQLKSNSLADSTNAKKIDYSTDITVWDNVVPDGDNTRSLGSTTLGFSDINAHQISDLTNVILKMDQINASGNIVLPDSGVTPTSNTIWLGKSGTISGSVASNNVILSPNFSTGASTSLANNILLGPSISAYLSGSDQNMIVLATHGAAPANYSNSTNGVVAITNLYWNNSPFSAVMIGGAYSGGRSVGLGPGCVASQDRSIAIGESCSSTSTSGIAIGGGSSVSHTASILLGAGASSTAANELLIFPGADYIRGSALGTKHFSPYTNLDVDLGQSGVKWNNIYANNIVTSTLSVQSERIALRFTSATAAVAAGALPWNGATGDITQDYNTALSRFSVQYQTTPTVIGPTFRNDSGATRYIQVSIITNTTTGTGTTGTLANYVDVVSAIDSAVDTTIYCSNNTSSNVSNAQTYKFGSTQIIPVPNGYYVRPIWDSGRLMNQEIGASFSIVEIA